MSLDSSLLVVIGVTGGDLLGAVELFGHDEPYELMWEDEWGERPDKIGSLPHPVVDAIGAADDKCD